jgi:hypothetical protein
VIVEWDSGKKYGQGQEIIRPGNDGEMEDSIDVYEDIFPEPMDID